MNDDRVGEDDISNVEKMTSEILEKIIRKELLQELYRETDFEKLKQSQKAEEDKLWFFKEGASKDKSEYIHGYYDDEKDEITWKVPDPDKGVTMKFNDVEMLYFLAEGVLQYLATENIRELNLKKFAKQLEQIANGIQVLENGKNG